MNIWSRRSTFKICIRWEQVKSYHNWHDQDEIEIRLGIGLLQDKDMIHTLVIMILGKNLIRLTMEMCAIEMHISILTRDACAHGNSINWHNFPFCDLNHHHLLIIIDLFLSLNWICLSGLKKKDIHYTIIFFEMAIAQIPKRTHTHAHAPNLTSTRESQFNDRRQNSGIIEIRHILSSIY